MATSEPPDSAYFKGTATTAQVDPRLVERLTEDGSATMLVYLRERADLSPAFHMDWRSRGRYVYGQLSSVAARSQAGVRAVLASHGLEHEAFWIDNVIVVRQAGRQALDALRLNSEVSAIMAEQPVVLFGPAALVDAPLGGGLVTAPGLGHVGAPQVWTMEITGQGMTVGSIDTGVNYLHPALVNRYRGNLGGGSFSHDYHWWNPYAPPIEPFDWQWHGTHTTGTMVGNENGSFQVGMAPGATWMACAGFDTDGSATNAGILACGQFMVAPTDLAGQNADPDRRPQVVNNSWGNCQQVYSDWYEGVIDAWIAAGIVPVFSNGNNSNCGYPAPPGLNTVGNPARSGKVLGIGSTGSSTTEPPGTPNGLYAPHANWGPTDNAAPGLPNYPDHGGYPNLKPNVSAPGELVLSSAFVNQYGWASGTSMAAPHVAGLVALMWSGAPCLVGDYAATGTIIQQTARPVPYASGGIPAPGPGNVPNYAAGWGEIDAPAAVAEALTRCGPHGTIEGHVTSAVSEVPLAGVTVTIHNPGGAPAQFIATTTGDGHYRFPFVPVLDSPQGSYTMSFVGGEGYGEASIDNIEVVDGSAQTIDVTLDAGFLIAPEALMLSLANGAAGSVFVALVNQGTLAAPATLQLEYGVVEQFEGAFPPPQWSVIDLGGDCPWRRNDQVTPTGWPTDPGHGGRPNLAGGSGYSAGADADACGAGTQIDSALMAPALDLGEATAVQVDLLAAFRQTGEALFAVEASGDGGDTWLPLLTWTTQMHPFGPGAVVNLDLSDFLGQSDVRVRFRYASAFDWYAQIDAFRAVITGGLDWAQLEETAPVVPPATSVSVELSVDSSLLPGPGVYPLTLLIEHNTPEQASPILVPVVVEVFVVEAIHSDGFEGVPRAR